MNWHWYDTVAFIFFWSLPAACFVVKGYMKRQWEKKFGEKKPR